jgi:hypothetical protein
MAGITVDYQTAFKNCGLDFTPFEAKGVKVAMNTSGVKFAKDGEIIASVPIAPGKVSELATAFDPKNQSHQTAKASLTTVFKQLEKKLGDPTAGTAAKTAPFYAPPQQVAPATAPMPADIKTVPFDKMKTDPVVQLKAADKLFQPVKGTSPGSRYFVVGIGAGVKVAARFAGKADGAAKISIRIEGEAFPKLTGKIQEAGVFGPNFGGSFGGDYASMHCAVEGKKEAQRLVGAVLGSMAPYIGHACPDIEPLVKAAA